MANIRTAQDGERKTDEESAALYLKADVHAKRFTRGKCPSIAQCTDFDTSSYQEMNIIQQIIPKRRFLHTRLQVSYVTFLLLFLQRCELWLPPFPKASDSFLTIFIPILFKSSSISSLHLLLCLPLFLLPSTVTLAICFGVFAFVFFRRHHSILVAGISHTLPPLVIPFHFVTAQQKYGIRV